jgi:hypothetical protein
MSVFCRRAHVADISSLIVQQRGCMDHGTLAVPCQSSKHGTVLAAVRMWCVWRSHPMAVVFICDRASIRWMLMRHQQYVTVPLSLDDGHSVSGSAALIRTRAL